MVSTNRSQFIDGIRVSHELRLTGREGVAWSQARSRFNSQRKQPEEDEPDLRHIQDVNKVVEEPRSSVVRVEV